MLNNKRGMSDVVMTVIMIGLVLIAVGVVWVAVQGILTKNTANIDVGQKCLGLGFEITGMGCNMDENKCFVEITRSAGSAGEGGEGVGLTFTQLTTTSEELYEPGNIAVSKRIEKILPLDIDGVTPIFSAVPTKVDARFYFNKDNGEKYFCPTTATYTVPVA